MDIFTHLRGRWPANAAASALAAVSLVCLLLAPVAAGQTLATGLVLGGIEDCVPTRVHVETLAEVERGLDAQGQLLVEASYSAANRSGVRTYNGDPADRAELARTLEPAEAAWWRREADGVPEGATDAQLAHAFVENAYHELGLDPTDTARSHMARGMHASLALALVALEASAASTAIAWAVARGDGAEVGETPFAGRGMTLAPAAASLASVVVAGLSCLALDGAPSVAVDLAAATVMVGGCLAGLGLEALLACSLPFGEKCAEAAGDAPDEPAMAEVLVFPTAGEDAPDPDSGES